MTRSKRGYLPPIFRISIRRTCSALTERTPCVRQRDDRAVCSVVPFFGEITFTLLAEPLQSAARSHRAARNAVIDAARADFGTAYIVFPNPAYGSWISALAKDYMTMSPEAREEFYAKTLTE